MLTPCYSNNVQHKEKRRELQASDVFLICADGVLLKGARKTLNQSWSLRWFSHRFAVCCNLVRFMSHSKPWNKSSKLLLPSLLCSIGVCSVACLVHRQSCPPVMSNHFTWWKQSMWKCKSEKQHFAVQRWKSWVRSTKNVECEKNISNSLWPDMQITLNEKQVIFQCILMRSSKLMWRTVSQQILCILKRNFGFLFSRKKIQHTTVKYEKVNCVDVVLI